MMYHKTDAFEKFEKISSFVKKTNFKIKDPDYDHMINEKQGVITNKEALQFIEKLKKLINVELDLVKPSERSLVSNSQCKIQNFQQCTQMLEWAGVSFGEEMHILIQKSLRRLAKVSGATQIKFFGKILCSGNDYWVAQGVLKESEETPRNKQQELRG
mmetsp:Transcript_18055/g.30798  ORF Transcript_18055/g.30798 Transcript_18055/m.30798 type:complete len:158 (-) Transcript_18055:870-1343(-)